jgi:hypothetical protein
MAGAVGVWLEAAGARVPTHGHVRRSVGSSWSKRQRAADAKVACEWLVSQRRARVRMPVGEGEVTRRLDRRRNSAKPSSDGRRWRQHTTERREEADEWARFEFKIHTKIKSAPNLIWSKHYHPSLEIFEIKYQEM